MQNGPGRYRVLVVGGEGDDVRSTAAEVDDRLDRPVDTETDRELAVDRIAHPEVLCLVYLGEPDGGGEGSFANLLVRSYPTLPVVATVPFPGDADPDAPEDVTFVDGPGPELAATVERTLADRIAARDPSTVPPAPDERWPNVDEAELDRLLNGDLDRDRLGELLHKSQLFDALFETLPLHMFVKDGSARHLYVSQRYFGDRADEFYGRIDPEVPLITPEHRWRAYEDDRYVIETGEEILDKEEFLGDVDMWSLTSKVPWRGPGGDIVGTFGVAVPITERKRRQQEVRERNERLDEFADLVSHDLRNPLQVAMARVDLARDGDDEHLDRAAEALARMEAIIEDVLSLARTGRDGVDREDVRLSAVAEEAWSLVESAEATLVVDPGVDREIRAEHAGLVRLFVNLFSNALDHGDAGTVRVGALEDGFFVADDGAGIPPDERDRVLEPGYSLSAQGTGFGLAIVARTAEAHGWTLALTESDGGGARFEFTGVGD